MQISRSMIVASVALVLLWSAVEQPIFSQTATDNSAANQNHIKTADDQPDAKADRMTTAKVRRAIIADKDLSIYAHNVKIITVNGAITLKGPVKTEEEKQKVASDVASIVSADKITNRLTVKQ